jgi:hypothetical protein
MTIVTTHYRYKRPSRTKPKAAAIQRPATVTSPDKKQPDLPDRPKPASAIVGPRKAASLPAWKDGDPRSPAEAVAGAGAADAGSRRRGEQAGRENHQATQ